MPVAKSVGRSADDVRGRAGAEPPGSITIDQLLALNEEIAALVRAGVPLERGLLVAGARPAGPAGPDRQRPLAAGSAGARAWSRRWRARSDRSRRFTARSSRPGRGRAGCRSRSRAWRGMSAAIPRPAPPSGWRSGIPSWCSPWRTRLFVGLVALVVPRFVAAFESLGLAEPAPLRWLSWLGETAHYWWPVGPIALVVLVIAWVRSGTAARFQARTWSWLRLFPWMRSILANYETANFSELLALLLEHRVPYPSALVLAAESTGDPRLTRGARQLAEAVARGEPPRRRWRRLDRRTFLPMLRWVLATGRSRARWSRPCTTSPMSTASAPSIRPKSCRCSCPRS